MTVKRKQRSKRHSSHRSQFGDFPMATGKYTGRPLRKVPRSYLTWMLDVGCASDADQWVIAKYLGRGEGGVK